MKIWMKMWIVKLFAIIPLYMMTAKQTISMVILSLFILFVIIEIHSVLHLHSVLEKK